MAFIEETIGTLVGQGFFDYILPFLLVFFVAYAIFQQTKVLGENKGINAVVAMLIGLFILYFARVFQVGRFLSFFTGKSMITIIILIFAMMITVFVFNVFKTNGMIKEKAEWKYALVIFGAALLLIFLALQSSPDTWAILGIPAVAIDTNVIISVFIIVGFFGVVAWIMGG